MSTASTDGRQVFHKRKLLRRFYEPLLLLNALGPIRGERTKPETNSDDSGANHRRTRRYFVDDIAYICAYEKGPDWVTAAALEKTPRQTIVWLAANSNVEQKVVVFLTSILDDLRSVSDHDKFEARVEAGKQLEEHFLRTVIDFNAPRIQTYHDDAVNVVSSCLDVIATKQTESTQDSKTTHLVDWLEQNIGNTVGAKLTGPDLVQLAQSCYGLRLRDSQILESLKLFAGQGQTRYLKFEQLYKLLCKLGKHVMVSRRLIKAAIRLYQDFTNGFVVETVKSSTFGQLPLLRKEANVESTAGRMFSSSEEKTRFLDRLQSVLNPDELSTVLLKEQAKKTRVHAEILLIDHFEKNGSNFLDGNDKYIGCSKPACYLCYAYINNHPGSYSLPASHQKIYVGWRLPDIYANDPRHKERLKLQEKILMKMIEIVRHDLSSDMESRTSRRPYHADSTAGLTATVESQFLKITTSLSAISVNDEATVKHEDTSSVNFDFVSSNTQEVNQVEEEEEVEEEKVEEGGKVLEEGEDYLEEGGEDSEDGGGVKL